MRDNSKSKIGDKRTKVDSTAAAHSAQRTESDQGLKSSRHNIRKWNFRQSGTKSSTETEVSSLPLYAVAVERIKQRSATADSIAPLELWNRPGMGGAVALRCSCEDKGSTNDLVFST